MITQEHVKLVRRMDRRFGLMGIARIHECVWNLVIMSAKKLKILADRINAEHLACLASAQDAIARAIEVGRLLDEAKTQTAHGQWMRWVQDNCSFGDRQARNYMRAYANREQIEARIGSGASDLDSLRSIVNELSAARDAPEDSDDHPQSDDEPATGYYRGEPAETTYREVGVVHKLKENVSRTVAVTISSVDPSELVYRRIPKKFVPEPARLITFQINQEPEKLADRLAEEFRGKRWRRLYTRMTELNSAK